MSGVDSRGDAKARRQRKQDVLDCPPDFSRESFLIARADGVKEVNGIVIEGLGLYLFSRWRCRNVKKDGTRTLKTIFVVVHLGSGHTVCSLESDFETAVNIVRHLQTLTDWTFTGLEGFKNVDPDLPEKFEAWLSECRFANRHGSGHFPEAATAISQTRW